MENFNRRRFLTRLTGIASISAVSTLYASLTPPQLRGPFYPSRLPPDSDADLTFVGQSQRQADGEIAILMGQVTRLNGTPVKNAVVEIWQCDAYGVYHHSRNDNGRDPFFQGFGRTKTDNHGHYRFRTIKPVAYPGRAPHIHIQIETASVELVTQVYVKRDPQNDHDFLLNSISDDVARESLILPFDRKSEFDELVATFNPVLD